TELTLLTLAALPVDVRLVQRFAVDHDPVLLVAAFDGLPTDGDDALDEIPLVRRSEPERGPDVLEEARDRITGRVRRGIVLHPRIGPAEDHDVPRTRIGEAVSDLVDEDPVRGAPGTAVQRLLHRARRDHVHPGDELLDEKRQYERDDDEDRQLFPEGTLLGLLLRLLLLLRALGRSGGFGHL